MKIYNPTPWDIKSFAGGVEYEVKAGQEEDIWVDEHAVIFCKHNREKGIVHLVFSNGMKEKYGTFAKFKQAQAVIGLKELRKQVDLARVYERQAMREIKESRGAEIDREAMDDGKFIKKLKLLDELIADAKGEAPKEEAKRGRGRPSGSVSNSSSATA